MILFEYLRENEKVCETVFVGSYGAQVESFKQNKGQKSRATAALKHFSNMASKVRKDIRKESSKLALENQLLKPDFLVIH